MTDLFAWVGGTITTFLTGAALVFTYYDTTQRVVGWLLGHFTWIAGGVVRWKLRNQVEGHVNRYLHRRLFAAPEGVESPRLKLRWVRDPEDPVLHRDGRLIVRIRDEPDPSRNYLNAVASALPAILVPRARPYLDVEFVEAVDMHVLMRLANSVSADAERAFATDFLGPRVAKFPSLREHLRHLDEIDRGGLFAAMLIQEMFYLDAMVALKVPAGGLHEEVLAFADWLYYLATREVGDESGGLTFIKEHLQVAVILLSKAATAEHGTAPYVSRMLTDLALGARHVYLLGVRENQGSLCNEVVKALGADRRVKLVNRITVVRRTRTTTPQSVPLALFHRQDLYFGDEGAVQLLAEAGIAPGRAIKGLVMSVGAKVAFVDIGEVSGRIRSLDLAWGYHGNTSDVLKVGESREFTVLEADPASLEVWLGLKQQTPSPWSSININPNDEVSCTVHSIKKSRIVVWLEESEIFGYIRVRDWTYCDAEDQLYVAPSPGLTTTAVVASVDAASECIQLDRRVTEVVDWDEIVEKYPVGSAVRVTVTRIGHEGLYCEIQPGIGGWIPRPALKAVGYEFADWRETMQLGQQLDAVVTRIQQNNKRFTFAL